MARPPVAIIGDSGTGKSTMIETLPPKRTLILNLENKPLPISNFNEFKNVMVTSFKALDSTLDALKKSEDYDYVILDSFTSLTEIINRYAEIAFKGYEVWAQYNSMITETLVKIKALPQQVFVIALPEQKSEEFGEKKEYARVKGKELKYGFFEKEFAIVLFTNPTYAEEDIKEKDIEAGEMVSVHMDYKPNKRNSAKAPRGLFKAKPKNDALEIATAINKFYGNS